MHNVHQVNTTLSLTTNAGVMTTNLNAELPGYSTVWFDPQSTLRRISKRSFTPRKHFPSTSDIKCPTIEENAKFLTPKEIAQANVANWLLHVLGYPSVVNLKTIIKTNMIQHNPATKSHLKLIEHLLGPDIPTVKGETTR